MKCNVTKASDRLPAITQNTIETQKISGFPMFAGVMAAPLPLNIRAHLGRGHIEREVFTI